jgi:hypothetical protein
MDDAVEVGSYVRFFSSRALAKVLEIDREYSAARVMLLDGVGGECWQKLDELEIVEWEKPRRRIEYRSVGVEK